MNNEQA